MKDLQYFISKHRGRLHGSPYDNYKQQEAFEKGFTACLDELEKYMADERKTLLEILERLFNREDK